MAVLPLLTFRGPFYFLDHRPGRAARRDSQSAAFAQVGAFVLSAPIMVDALRPSREYDQMSQRWKRMRDCVAGSDAVRGQGTAYLPALMGHFTGSRLNAEYIAYKPGPCSTTRPAGRWTDSAGWFFADPRSRTCRRRRATTDDVDLLGRRLDDFADACLREVLTTGRVGVLVEHTAAPVSRRSSPRSRRGRT